MNQPPSTRLPDDGLDPTRCPLCGGDNRCAMELERATGETQGPCWCVTAAFPPDLLGRLPVEAQGKACICGKCLAAHNAGLSSAMPPKSLP